MKNIFTLLVIFTGLLGCAPSDEVADEKPAVVFQGKPDSRFVGTWNAEGSGSIYEFKEDGTYNLKGKVKMQGGTYDNNSSGSWAVDQEKLLIKDQHGNVTPYAIDFKDPVLTLSLTGSLKNKTVLKRQ